MNDIALSAIAAFKRAPRKHATQQAKAQAEVRIQELPQVEERQFPLSRTDLVFAIPTHKATEAQLKAGRSNRMVCNCLEVFKEAGLLFAKARS